MADTRLKIEIKINYPVFFGIAFAIHLFLLFFQYPTADHIKLESKTRRSPLKIHTLGTKESKSANSVFLKPDAPSLPSPQKTKTGPKHLDLSDLSFATPPKKPALVANPDRPGQMPKQTPALKGLRYGQEDFKKMATEDTIGRGGADILNSRQVALNFEIPEGKKTDELNESELRLYGFMRRGALKYMASISSEIKEFEMKNPHLHFPLTDTKQIMTGRLTYDGQGNIKQIKMVRWTNVEKLQGFFENVVKRLDTLQNPPKELWIEDGEFTIFVTLQING